MALFWQYFKRLTFVITLFPMIGMIGGLLVAIIYTLNDNLNDNPQMILQAAWARTSLAAGLVFTPAYIYGLRRGFSLRKSEKEFYQSVTAEYDAWLDRLGDQYRLLGKCIIVLWPYLVMTLLWTLIAVFYYYAIIYWPHALKQSFLQGYKVMTWIPVTIIGISPAVQNYKYLINYSRYFNKELQ